MMQKKKNINTSKIYMIKDVLQKNNLQTKRKK